ncbi:MAG: hypothetical protein RL189_2139 [Pseudomonadota bacterium]
MIPVHVLLARDLLFGEGAFSFGGTARFGERVMTTRKLIVLFALTAQLIPACVSSEQSAEPQNSSDLINAKTYGVLDREDEVYPWLAPQYDKGIYGSSAHTAPFRENAVTSENLRKRIQKTSKKSKK